LIFWLLRGKQRGKQFCGYVRTIADGLEQSCAQTAIRALVGVVTAECFRKLFTGPEALAASSGYAVERDR